MRRAGLVERLVLGALLACLTGHAAAQLEAPVRLEVTGTLRLAADGAVTEFKPDPRVNTAVATQVAKSMGTWQLASTSGESVDGDTHVRLALEAVPIERGYGLRLTDAWFGAPTLAPGAPPPDYPRVLLEARAGARVLLQLRMDGKGGVAHAAVKDAGLLTHIKDDAIRTKWRERFGQASLEAAQRWTFIAGARPGGAIAFPQEVLVLVTFWPRDIRGDTSYRHMGWPMATSPWTIQNDTTLPPGTVLVDPRVLPVDSTLSLRAGEVGSLL